ncbi:MAG TPA: LysR family transcriptional regulator [Ramlibacter sp.]|jgi:DNA-binding transcriptional LysR family regulator|nr:LysR family transcriptional regulator [Ramlibacter sp.]
MDQIQSMRVFARVVESGSFTRAAESLTLPKGTVTKLVQRLEERLRVKLLNRTTRRVTVTPEGAAYYERTSRVLNDIDDIEASMTNAHASPSGRLRVDVGSTIASLIVIPALPDFFARYPDIRLELGVGERPVDLVSENVDCVIRGGVIAEQSLVARRIASLELMTVATPAYLARHGTPAHPRDIEESHTMIAFMSARTGQLFPEIFDNGSERIEFMAPRRMMVNEGNAFLAATLAGLGIGQVARFAAQSHLERGELVEVLPEWKHPPVPLHVVYPPNRHLSAKTRAFVDWAADLFAKHPGL